MTRFGWPLLGLGALAALACAGQPWWRIRSDAGGVELAGNLTTGGLTSALPAVALVGIVLGLTLRRVGRRLLTVVLALVGAAAVATGAVHPRPSDAVLTEQLRKVSLADDWTAAATPWPWVYAAASLLIVAGAAAAFVAAGRHRGAAHRFEPETDPATATSPASDPADPAEAAAEADLDQWKALDAGVDPTAGAPISPNPRAREQ